MNKALLIILAGVVVVGGIYVYNTSRSPSVSVGAKGKKDAGVLSGPKRQYAIGGARSGVSVSVDATNAIGQFLSGIWHNTEANGETLTATSQIATTATLPS